MLRACGCRGTAASGTDEAARRGTAPSPVNGRREAERLTARRRPHSNSSLVRIFSGQIDRMQVSVNLRFAAQLAPVVRPDLPPALAGIAERDLVARILQVLDRARGYGLTSDRDLRAFVRLHFAVGPRFDAHPFFATILRDDEIPADERMDWIFALAEPEHWSAAAALDPHTR